MAAQTPGLKISPVKTSVSARAGETITVPIVLQNSTNKPLTALVSAKDFTASDSLSGEPRLLEAPNQKYGLSNWLKDSNIQKSLTIPAKQTVEYRALFNVPASAQPRSYFGSVIFTYTPDDGQPVSLGSLVFITVGNPAVQLSVDSLAHQVSEAATEPHGVVTAILKNAGEGLANPQFRLKITGNYGRLIEELTDETAGSILPESSRRYTFAPTKPFPAEHLTFTLSATDQYGNTVDKSFQQDLRKDENTPAANTNNSSDLGQSPTLVLFTVLLALILGTGVFMLKRRTKTIEVPPELEPTADTSEEEPIHNPNKNSSN